MICNPLLVVLLSAFFAMAAFADEQRDNAMFNMGESHATCSIMLGEAGKMVTMIKLGGMSAEGKEIAWVTIDSDLMVVAAQAATIHDPPAMFDTLTKIDDRSSTDILRMILKYRKEQNHVSDDVRTEQAIHQLEDVKSIKAMLMASKP